MYEVKFLATSSADWSEAIEWTDAVTNQPFDFTGMTFEMDVRDRCGDQVLTRTTADGTITNPQPGILQWTFPASQMASRCQGTYRVGMVMTDPDENKTQLFIGSLVILDGDVS